MVYTSIPPYLHPPNWSQQQQPPASAPQGLQGVGMTGVTVGSEATLQLPQPSSSIARSSENNMTVGARPTSMAERARLARVPQPEAALKCPRCDSTNTKFCYFNNYSLSQPRHFCKNCRRYWTRGGALRNVPVGGGCRRNKRSKSRSATIERPSGTSTAAVSTGVPIIPSTIAQLPFMGSFHSLPDYGAPSNVVGLSYGNVDPHVGSSSAAAGGGFEQWRLQQQQLPFLSGLEQPSSVPPSSSLGLYHQLDGEEGGSFVGQVQAKPSVKVEESSQDQLRLRTQYHGMNPSGDRYWDGAGTSGGNAGSGGANWGDLSATFASSTMGHLL